MQTYEIIDYEPQHKASVKALNYEWLKKYDLWEPLDDVYLDHPEEKIIGKGGFILLAKAGEEIIGTISLVPSGLEEAEICKLCVRSDWQRKGIGEALMKHTIEKSKNMGIQTLILYSNHQLENALKMYKKLGFYLIEDVDQKYEVSDIKMALRIR